MKMSMPFGKCTVTTTISGRGNLGIEQLVIPGLLVGAAALAAGAYAHQIDLALTILAVIALIAVLAKPVYVLATELTWPHQRRRIQAFSARVDAAFAARDAELEPAAPLRVAAERVHELEAPSPAMAYVVDPDREAAPVDLDALDA